MMKKDSESPPHGPLNGVLVSWQQGETHAAPNRSERSGTRTRRWLTLLPLALAIVAVLCTLLLAGCATAPKAAPAPLLPEIRAALSKEAGKPAPLPPAIAQALVPPADLSMPALGTRSGEPRFDVNVVNLPVAQVFAALAKDTRYSILVDPELKNSVTVNLKDVTLVEALETMREMFGFEYRIQGTRIYIQPASLTTRVFQVNYLLASRSGRSDVRVTSGSISLAGNGTSGAAPAPATGSGSTPGQSSSGGSAQESSRVTTQTHNDLWTELEASLKLLLGTESGKGDGRQLIVSPQSGVIVVRAYPRELRQVDAFLRASRVNVERQVMLEAKIVDVTLQESFQNGVNWAAFHRANNSNGAAGLLSPGSSLANSGDLNGGGISAVPGSALALSAAAPSGLFGLAFQSSNFAALINFLETQGNVQVLSSPRIAAINNQKAVLKVGTDDFFVTSVSTTTNSTATGNVVSPTITVQPFFSGIAFDVTPQIDEDGNVMLHVHPSVSNVAERNKVLNLGQLGSFTLPLASSSISESDTVVRVHDGSIVAIGGLMKTSLANDKTQVPGVGDVPGLGLLFGSRSRDLEKHELVILIKPTVIHTDAQLDALREDALARLESLGAPQ